MPLALLAFCLLQQPTLTDGPSMPLAIVEGVKTHRIEVSKHWVDGFYSVRFEYRITKPVSSLAELCKKEKWIETQNDWPAQKRFLMNRSHDGLQQDVVVQQNVLEYVQSGPEGTTHGKKVDPYTTVIVSESADLAQKPRTYFRGAYALKPPVPLIEVPFMKGHYAKSVEVTGFSYLMAPGRILPGGDDAYVFCALVPGDWETIAERAKQWAEANGYSQTSTLMWFKPKVRMFEVTVSPHGEFTAVRMYVTDREALRPLPTEW
jgi:hypothetical protein